MYEKSESRSENPLLSINVLICNARVARLLTIVLSSVMATKHAFVNATTKNEKFMHGNETVDS